MSNEEKKKSKKGLLGYLVLAALLVGVSTFSIYYVCTYPPVKQTAHTPKVFSVTFSDSTIESINVSEGGLITKPADPSKAGYDFGGWFKDEGCEFKWDFNNDKVTENTILYPKWIEETSTSSYTVTFDMKEHGDQVPSQTVEEGSLLTEPTGPTAEYFLFGGWFKDENYEFKWNFIEDKVTENTTLYANWIYLCEFQFDMNEDAVPGDPANMVGYDFMGNWPDPVEVPYGSIAKDFKPTIEEPVAENVGDVEFVGWCRDREGNVPWDWNSDIASGDIILYAGWHISNIK